MTDSLRAILRGEWIRGEEAPPRTPRWALALLALSLLVLATLFAARRGRPLLESGDVVSDTSAVIGSSHLAADGFVRLRFLPVVRPGPLEEEPAYYTHYPPIPDMLGGLSRRLGAQGVPGLRILPAACTLLSILCWHMGLRRLLPPSEAAIAAAAIALSYPTVWLGDSVHHYAYGELARAAVLALGVTIGASPQPRPGLTALLATLLAVQINIAFDYVLWSQVVLLGVGVTGLSRERLPRTLVLALAPVVGFGLHLAQNAWAIGPEAAFDDMFGAMLHRTVGASTEQAGLLSPLRWGNAVLGRVPRFYGYCAAAVVTLGLIGVLSRARREDTPEESRAEPRPSRKGRVLLLFVAAAFSWFIVLAQHTVAHTYTVRHYAPALGVAIALGLSALPRLLAPSGPLAARAGTAIIVAMLACEATFPLFGERFKPTFPRAAEDLARELRDRIPADAALVQVPGILPFTAIESVLERPTFAVGDAAALEALRARHAALRRDPSLATPRARIATAGAPTAHEGDLARARRLVVFRAVGAPFSPPLEALLHRIGRPLHRDERGELLELDDLAPGRS